MATEPVAAPTPEAPQDDELSLETSNYEVIRKRLVEQGRRLAAKADALNAQRLEFFGSTAMHVIGNQTITTETNCIPQDIVNLGDRLLFGYNVRRAMSQTKIEDVFSLHKFTKSGEELQLAHIPQDTAENFLSDPAFVKDFDALYFSFKSAFLRQLRRPEGRLLAIFQTGTTLKDTRVLRWAVDAHEQISYLDNTGERDNVVMRAHDFSWVATQREDHITGRHPHISIQDRVFVETVGGDLTIKVEDNTEDGKGIYAEPVEDRNQSLGDADISYAVVNNLILLRIKPYRETLYRYFVFNALTRTVHRLDNIGLSCVSLPEDHGVIFPGGYVLESGEIKTFDQDLEGMRIEQIVRSPNGEDVLYAFYQPQLGQYFLLSYNMIRKEVLNPILCHGYSIFEDGTMIVFRSTGEQATRHHPMQIWQTPYVSEQFAAQVPNDGSFLSKVGNAELVRGISDAYTVRKVINTQKPTTELYGSIVRAAERMIDQYYWLGEQEVDDFTSDLRQIARTAQLVIEEFAKVRQMRDQAAQALTGAEKEQARLIAEVRHPNWKEIGRFVAGLEGLRAQRGRLITMREMKYIDLERIDALEAGVITHYDQLSQKTVEFLMGEGALASYQESVAGVIGQVEGLDTTVQAKEIKERLGEIGEGLNVLTEVISGLKIEDPNARTHILESIAEVLGQQNRARAMVEAKMRTLLESEGRAEFAVQFQLLGQAVTSAIGMSETPQRCDEQLERMMIQLQEMEGRFSEFDVFLAKLTEKREEIYEVFETRKQQLIEARQRKASAVSQAADKILEGIARRAKRMDDVEAMNAYFAADAMVIKIREMATQLRALEEAVRADDLENQLKATRDQAIRTLRDKIDLFEGGEAVIRLGKHRFSVNTQPLELTMVPRDGDFRLHITGTDFYEPIEAKEFLETRDLWTQQLVSETKTVARAEYLAACILFDAQRRIKGPGVQELHQMLADEDQMLKFVRSYIEERYDEGYERGVHDVDTVAILKALLGMYVTAGLLRFSPPARALAILCWAHPPADPAKAPAAEGPLLTARQNSQESPVARQRRLLARRAQSLGRLRKAFAHADAAQALQEEVEEALEAFMRRSDLDALGSYVPEAAAYLIEELAAHDPPRFVLNREAERLGTKFIDHLESSGARGAFEEDLEALGGEVEAAWELVSGWLGAFAAGREGADATEALMPEAIAHIMTKGRLEREVSSAKSEAVVDGLLAQHPLIHDQKLVLRLDDFLTRLTLYIGHHVPRYRRYRELSHALLEGQRKKLRLEELTPKVLSTFVRNKLIDEVYLPLIGDNLAKQMGSAGQSGRSDRQGLLLLISPPGYGKTTLMEYVASRLGLTFMKINGPALGHHVTSLDPAQAPNATARQEVVKMNLALRMGNNVMLYLDDIQHCHPELLQKFISLCDATRRIEGVWEGETKTYDLRGKRFGVVMAGNPYTETGDRFQIPDMLANRADTYNLGDILEGTQDAFALSYIENALTSNTVLAPLANREKGDIYLFIRMAQGEEIPLSDLKHAYSALEANEIVNVLGKLFVCQQVLLQVNQQYVRSASQDDAFRTEPPFKLQGSYRNMTKLAEKVVSAMNAQELQALIDDHYLGESQTLTTDAEQNLLKLGELRGTLDAQGKARWEQIKTEFRRRTMMGGGGADDPVSRVAGPLASLVQQVENLQGVMQDQRGLLPPLAGIRDAIGAAMETFTQAQHSRPAPDPQLGPQMLAKLTEAIAALQPAQPLGPLQISQPEGPVVYESPQLEVLMQRQATLVESALNTLARLTEAHLEGQMHSQAVLTQIEKLVEQGASLRSPPASRRPGAGTSGARDEVEERPLTGSTRKLSFKQALRHKQAEEPEEEGPKKPNGQGHATQDPAGQDLAQDSEPLEPTSPIRPMRPRHIDAEDAPDAASQAVKLEPPFDGE